MIFDAKDEARALCRLHSVPWNEIDQTPHLRLSQVEVGNGEPLSGVSVTGRLGAQGLGLCDAAFCHGFAMLREARRLVAWPSRVDGDRFAREGWEAVWKGRFIVIRLRDAQQRNSPTAHITSESCLAAFQGRGLPVSARMPLLHHRPTLPRVQSLPVQARGPRISAMHSLMHDRAKQLPKRRLNSRRFCCSRLVSTYHCCSMTPPLLQTTTTYDCD